MPYQIPLPPLLPVIVHNDAHVHALLSALHHQNDTRRVELWSPPDAVRWQGPRWLWLLCHHQAKTFPNCNWTYVLDCGDAVGMALTALDDGIPGIAIINAPPAALNELRETAHRKSARLFDHRPLRLDLGQSSDPLHTCHALLNHDQNLIKGALCSGHTP